MHHSLKVSNKESVFTTKIFFLCFMFYAAVVARENNKINAFLLSWKTFLFIYLAK